MSISSVSPYSAVINGQTCTTCADEDFARSVADPSKTQDNAAAAVQAAPQDAAVGSQPAPKVDASDAVSFGGSLAGIDPATSVTPTAKTIGSIVDLRA